jgi:antitoxin component YwqK of YwqJK toxin-antitoxin module
MNPLPLFLIIVTLPLLLGGCGGKNQTTEETKPSEENQGEVKQEAKTEEPVAVTKSKLVGGEGVSVEELEPRERLVYRIGSDVPYTGKSFELYPNGELEEVITYKDGIPNGLMTQWYMNGQKEAEVNFKDGKPDGLIVEWHETGEKMSEVTYKDGRPVDGSEKFFERQELTEEEIERFEEPEVYSNVTLKWSNKDGIFRDIKSDKPYSGKAVGLWPNGNKRIERNYKDGKADGLEVLWHENGQKKEEVNWKDNESASPTKYWNSKGEPVDSLEESRE